MFRNAQIEIGASSHFRVPGPLPCHNYRDLNPSSLQVVSPTGLVAYMTPPAKGRYDSAEYVAPMVRASTLPFREECLKYGATYAFTEELIDRKILTCFKSEWEDGTVVFQTEKDSARTVQFRPESTERTILQLGTADGVLASKAALMLIDNVSEVNVNMGCPKSFSISGGMGAALLSKPELATDIVRTLRSELPANFPLTCKIRYIGDEQDAETMIKRTSEFMVGLIDAGANAISVHMRTVPMRPRDPAIWPLFTDLIQAMPAAYSTTPIIANGDFFNRSQIGLFRESVHGKLEGTGRSWCDSAMVARGAIWNPAIFSTDPSILSEQVVAGFFHSCVKYRESKAATKWILAQMMEGRTEYNGNPVRAVRDKIHQGKSMDDLRDAVIFDATHGDASPVHKKIRSDLV